MFTKSNKSCTNVNIGLDYYILCAQTTEHHKEQDLEKSILVNLNYKTTEDSQNMKHELTREECRLRSDSVKCM